MSWKMIGSSSSVTAPGRHTTGGSGIRQATGILHVGSVAELGAGTQRRQQVAEQIVAVAEANGGIYSAQFHDGISAPVQPGLDRPGDCIELFGPQTPGWHLSPGSMGRACAHWKPGSTPSMPTRSRISASAEAQRTDVRVIAEHSLAKAN